MSALYDPEKNTSLSIRSDVASGVDAESAKSTLPKKWTGKRIAWVSALIFLAIVVIVLVITLPIVLLGHHRTRPDDPSYRDQENAPMRVLDNFPDPGLLHVNGTWVAFGTNSAINKTDVVHVPVATSTDFTQWERNKTHDAMPTVGGWEMNINHWAPDTIQRADGKFLLYYSGELKDWSRHHCVGVAVSESTDPLGPYKPESKPLACTRKLGGSIDPSPFRDTDGKLYVTYKVDANSIGNGGNCNNGRNPIVSVPIVLQELDSDGVSTVGEGIEILRNEREDGPLVEAPNIIRSDQGMYFLFFSSHCFNSPQYDVKYAYSRSLKGPYTRADRPLLKTGDFGLVSPGGATVAPDGTKMVFHANCGGKRCMFVAGIDISAANSTILPAPL